MSAATDDATTIRLRWRLQARAFRGLFRVLVALRFTSAELQFATKPIAAPEAITVPTRHGPIRCLLYKPTDADIAAARAKGALPPLHVQTHPGAFIVRLPQQEDNVARYLASEIGCYVLVADYDTAPDVTFPVAEEENFDVFLWAHEHGPERGWDRDRVSVGGASAGAKFALSVVQQAIDAGGIVPVAVTTEYGVSDLSIPDAQKTSPKRVPVINGGIMKMVKNTYFAGVDLALPRVSPARFGRLAEFPPTLITTGSLDTLRHEMHRLADDLEAGGVPVTYHEFPGVDHGYTHDRPVEVARDAIVMIGEHLNAAYSRATTAPQRDRGGAVPLATGDGR